MWRGAVPRSPPPKEPELAVSTPDAKTAEGELKTVRRMSHAPSVFEAQERSYFFQLSPEHQQIRDEWWPRYKPTLAAQARAWAETSLEKGLRMPQKRLKALGRIGIPPDKRPRVWRKVLKADLLEKDPANAHFYTRVCEQARKLRHDKEAPIYIREIEKDVDRTFTNHPFFLRPQGVASLRRVLMAYAIRRPDIGYCQSMNYIAGFLLLFFKEEEAFWMLCRIIDSLLPKDYFSKQVLGAMVDSATLVSLVERQLPRLHEHCHKLGLDLTAACAPWFLCLYIKTLPVETVLRVWDALFVEGTKVLFRVGLALFHLYAQQIMGIHDEASLFMFVSQMGRGLFDCDLLMKTAFSKVNLRRATIEKYRKIHRDRLTAEYERRMAAVASRIAAPSSSLLSSPPAPSAKAPSDIADRRENREAPSVADRDDYEEFDAQEAAALDGFR